jgi:hypothetical protein
MHVAKSPLQSHLDGDAARCIDGEPACWPARLHDQPTGIYSCASRACVGRKSGSWPSFALRMTLLLPGIPGYFVICS